MNFYGGIGFAQYDKDPAAAAIEKIKYLMKLRKITVPRVVINQRFKYEHDPSFRILSTDNVVRYVNHADKPHDHDSCQLDFNAEYQRGGLTITILPMGKTLSLDFGWYQASSSPPQENGCDFVKEIGKVHIASSFIMDGVCVKFKGWLDCASLEGKGRIEFDELNARREHEKAYGIQPA